MIEKVTFGSPLWLVAGVLTVVLLLLFLRKMGQRRQRELQRFVASSLLGKLCGNVSGGRRYFKRILLLTAIACCFVALARPQYGSKWIEVKRKGIDILFAVDTSKSMLAEDVRPNRLERAKFAIMDFVAQLQGDRVGLLPFAGSAFLLCPLTIDYDAFEGSLGVIDTTIIPKGGTDLAAAISEAEVVLSNEANHKILVLITDGENLEGDVVQAAQDAAEKGMTIYTVGVGTSEGELIPLSRDGKSGFVKGAGGNFVTSHLDEKMLTTIAEASGGLYVPLGSSGEGLQTIYQEKLSLIPKEELAEKRHKVPVERFSWPLAAAIVLLAIEFLVGGRKSSRSLRIPFIKTAGRRGPQVGMGLLLLIVLSTLARQVFASPGEEAYGKGDFITAAQFYDEQLKTAPNDARLHYNYGTAAYKNNMFEDAAKAFKDALKSSDLGVQQEAYYNRGNALFMRGKETVKTDPEHSMEKWQEAVASYDGALQLNPENDDARVNLALVQKRLEVLQKQQEQQQKKQQKDKDQSEDQNQQQEGQKKQPGKEGQQGDQGQGSEDGATKKEGPPEENGPPGGQNQEQDQGAQSGKDGSGQEPGDASQKEAVLPPGKGAEEAQKEAQLGAAAVKKQEQQARDQRRRVQGKMTSEEAKQLLDSIRDEEGELNFIPSSGSAGGNDHKISKDW